MESMDYNYFGAGLEGAEQPAYGSFPYTPDAPDAAGGIWQDSYAPTWTGPCRVGPYGVILVDGFANDQNLVPQSPAESLIAESEPSDLLYLEGSIVPNVEHRRSLDIPSVSDVKKRQRREQNRAAQRAFRERKVQAITDLQANVTTLETQASDLRSENQQLRHDLGESRKEVEILRSVISKRCNSLVFATQTQQGEPPAQTSSCLVLKLDADETKAPEMPKPLP